MFFLIDKRKLSYAVLKTKLAFVFHILHFQVFLLSFSRGGKVTT